MEVFGWWKYAKEKALATDQADKKGSEEDEATFVPLFGSTPFIRLIRG